MHLCQVDAAARILDPIAVAENAGRRLFGCFIKDYHECEW